MEEPNIFAIAIDQGDARFPNEPAGTLYEPLQDDDIRIVTILPGDPKSEICCRLRQVHLTDNMDYVALSYAWGSGPSNCTIRINGHRFFVRKNLWRFLLQARSLRSLSSGTFWIDAICIDQPNSNERNHQVHLMPTIYSAARQVLVWLGPLYGHSDDAMRAIAKPRRQWQKKKKAPMVCTQAHGLAILSLCHRNYWTRLWIFQEILLARRIDVLCGNQVVPWSLFRPFLLELHSSTPTMRVANRLEYEHIQLSPAMSLLRQTNRQDGSATLWNLLFGTQHLNCAEIRDKVYGLLGVAVAGHMNISPDYTVPLPTLLNAVLREQHKLERPGSIKQVEDQCKQLAAIFGLGPASVFTMTGQRGQISVPESSDMASLPLGPSASLVTLWWAVFFDHGEVEQLLFERGTVDHQDLLSASRDGNNETVRLLLNTGRLDINFADEGGLTPLLLALTNGHLATVKLLLGTPGTNFNAQDQKHNAPLHIATKRRYTKIVKLLLGTPGTNVNAQDQQHDTPLHIATIRKYTEIVKLLLETQGTEVNARDEHGSTPLHVAVFNGYKTIVQLLLGTGKVEINAKDLQGCTPLHMAAKLKRSEIAKILLDEGAEDANLSEAIRWNKYMAWQSLHPKMKYARKMSDKNSIRKDLAAHQIQPRQKYICTPDSLDY